MYKLKENACFLVQIRSVILLLSDLVKLAVHLTCIVRYQIATMCNR